MRLLAFFVFLRAFCLRDSLPPRKRGYTRGIRGSSPARNPCDWSAFGLFVFEVWSLQFSVEFIDIWMPRRQYFALFARYLNWRGHVRNLVLFEDFRVFSKTHECDPTIFFRVRCFKPFRLMVVFLTYFHDMVWDCVPFFPAGWLFFGGLGIAKSGPAPFWNAFSLEDSRGFVVECRMTDHWHHGASV